jgi:hypothetical protein
MMALCTGAQHDHTPHVCVYVVMQPDHWMTLCTDAQQIPGMSIHVHLIYVYSIYIYICSYATRSSDESEQVLYIQDRYPACKLQQHRFHTRTYAHMEQEQNQLSCPGI